ncbi:MAG TPA: hypothetical protein VE008_12420 [Burkholderiales bacterium]|nr:hypothetical protein [Burkholderiales bacterium]
MSSRAKRAISAAVEATRLLGKWTRLAQGHALFGGGCSCGLGFASLSLRDFEPQILDYLKSKHRVGGFAAVPDLLRSIVKEGEREGQLALLADLERSLDSFDELHRGTRV